MESFTDRLKQAIDRSGYKAKDIASAAGISPQHLSNYCRGTANPKKNMINKLAAALDVDPLWLQTGINKQEMRNADVPRADTIYTLDTLPARGGRSMHKILEVQIGEYIYQFDPLMSIVDGCIVLAEKADDSERRVGRLVMTAPREFMLLPLDDLKSTAPVKMKKGEVALTKAYRRLKMEEL